MTSRGKITRLKGLPAIFAIPPLPYLAVKVCSTTDVDEAVFWVVEIYMMQSSLHMSRKNGVLTDADQNEGIWSYIDHLHFLDAIPSRAAFGIACG